MSRAPVKKGERRRAPPKEMKKSPTEKPGLHKGPPRKNVLGAKRKD